MVEGGGVKSYDEGQIDSGRTSSGRNPAFNLYIHRCIICFAILESQVRCYCTLYLLSFIVTKHWTKCQYELYSNSRVVVYYIEGHFYFLFFVSIIGCHNCSYSAIYNRYLYLKIQLYDTFSLSPSCALDIVL